MKELTTDEKFMKAAIRRAKEAEKLGEVPIGAVLVRDGVIIASGKNMRESKKDALLHAEISAIRRACRKMDAWRLCGCTLYVTLEPCPMCAGAIVNARIPRVVFGAYDAKAGAFGSVMDINSFPLNHQCEAVGGVLESECAALLSDFFRALRKQPKKKDISPKSSQE